MYKKVGTKKDGVGITQKSMFIYTDVEDERGRHLNEEAKPARPFLALASFMCVCFSVSVPSLLFRRRRRRWRRRRVDDDDKKRTHTTLTGCVLEAVVVPLFLLGYIWLGSCSLMEKRHHITFCC